MYGRGANALCREILKAGVHTTPELCQAIIDSVAASYAVAWAWICNNAEKAVEQEYIENAFGRRRYFTGARQMSESAQASVKREAKNSPIQGLVADLLARGGINLYRLKHRTKVGSALDFKILLPIHDAFLFECRDEHIPAFIKGATMCMSTSNLIPGTNSYLRLDIEVMKRWGEH